MIKSRRVCVVGIYVYYAAYYSSLKALYLETESIQCTILPGSYSEGFVGLSCEFCWSMTISAGVSQPKIPQTVRSLFMKHSITNVHNTNTRSGNIFGKGWALSLSKFSLAELSLWLAERLLYSCSQHRTFIRPYT